MHDGCSNESTAPTPDQQPTPLGDGPQTGIMSRALKVAVAMYERFRVLISKTAPRKGGHVEFVHAWSGWSDSFEIVKVRGRDRRPICVCVHHKEIHELRAALDAFEKRVRERHNARPVMPRGER
jgi:hypothetical protein